MTDLSVVIPSYETRGLLLECLEGVARARAAHPKLDCEVVVVDNGSRDGSVEAVRERHPGVRVLAGARNRGFAAAVNRGLRARRGRHALLLNSDVEIAPDLLAAGVRLLDAHPDVGVLGGSLCHPGGRPQRSAHRLPGLASELLPGEIFRRPARGRSGVSRRGPDGDRELVDVEAVRGAVLFVRGEALDALGLLDEGFFFFLEDTEYCARVRRAGLRVAQAPGLRAVHRLGASSKQRAPLATRIEYHRSLYRFLSRERGATTARVVCLSRMLRGLGLCLGLVLVAGFRPAERSRLAERWGLLVWHLRGCPDAPRLAEALAAGGSGAMGGGRREGLL